MMTRDSLNGFRTALPLDRSPPVYMPVRAKVFFAVVLAAFTVMATIGLYLMAKGLHL